MRRALPLLLLMGLPPLLAARAQPVETIPETAATTFYRRSSLAAEYVRRRYVEGDEGTGFAVHFTAEPLAFRAPLGGGLAMGGLVGGGIGFGAVRRQLPADTTVRSFVLNQYEATALAGLEAPLGLDVRVGLFGGYSAQGLRTTFPRHGPLVRLRLNTVPLRIEGNALLTGDKEGSVHVIVPIPTGDLLRGALAFGFHATRYETDRSGVVKLFGFSINAMDF